MWVSEWLLLRKCSETAACIDTIRSRVEYRSSMLSMFDGHYTKTSYRIRQTHA